MHSSWSRAVVHYVVEKVAAVAVVHFLVHPHMAAQVFVYHQYGDLVEEDVVVEHQDLKGLAYFKSVMIT